MYSVKNHTSALPYRIRHDDEFFVFHCLETDLGPVQPVRENQRVDTSVLMWCVSFFVWIPIIICFVCPVLFVLALFTFVPLSLSLYYWSPNFRLWLVFVLWISAFFSGVMVSLARCCKPEHWALSDPQWETMCVRPSGLSTPLDHTWTQSILFKCLAFFLTFLLLFSLFLLNK